MKIMRGLLGLGMLVATSVFAGDPKTAFDEGIYASAAQALEQRLASAPPSAEGYSNLGLAFERAGEPVKASLNYQRALLLDPTLKPARNQLAALAAAHRIPVSPRRWTDDVNAVIHPDTLVLAGTALFWIGAFGLLLASRAQGRAGGRKALAAVGLAFGLGAFVVGWLTDARLAAARPAMISTKEGTEMLTAPAGNSDVIVSLPPGTPVGVMSPRGAWTYVHLASGANGWVQSDRLTPIVPGEKF